MRNNNEGGNREQKKRKEKYDREKGPVQCCRQRGKQ